jgi:hypothetical protein
MIFYLTFDWFCSLNQMTRILPTSRKSNDAVSDLSSGIIKERTEPGPGLMIELAFFCVDVSTSCRAWENPYNYKNNAQGMELQNVQSEEREKKNKFQTQWCKLVEAEVPLSNDCDGSGADERVRRKMERKKLFESLSIRGTLIKRTFLHETQIPLRVVLTEDYATLPQSKD